MLPGIQEFYDGGLIAGIVVFVALPYLYLSLASQVQAEYTEVIKSVVAKGTPLKNMTLGALKEELEERIHVFQVDWWFIAALGVLMLFFFKLDMLLELSDYFKNVCSASDAPGLNCQVRGISQNGIALNCPHALDACRWMKKTLATYTLGVGLVFAFRIWWERVSVARDLRAFYAEMEYAEQGP